MLPPIIIPPGVYQRGTEEQAGTRWRDANLARWYGPAVGPIGGSRKRGTAQADGKVRAILPWRDNAGNRWIAIATHTKLYVMNAALALVDITPAGYTAGRADSTILTGYGFGPYGSGTYGTPRTDSGITAPATVWLLDTWGEYLVAANADDGKLYEWQLNPAVPAQVISGAPTGCRGVIATDDFFLMALGAGNNGRKLQWSDQENPTVWTPMATNQAGDFQLNTAGAIQTAVSLRGALLILTTLDAHVATYQGLPFVYGFERVGEGCGAISQGALVSTGVTAFWMSDSGFWSYDGGIQPLECEVHDFVFGGMNPAQKAKVTGFHNTNHSEVWWFFPSSASTENDSYVAYNYREGWWTIGRLARTAAAGPGVFQTTPFATDPDGFTYEHEVGGVDLPTAYAETGKFALGDGEQVAMVRRVQVDGTQVATPLTLTTYIEQNGVADLEVTTSFTRSQPHVRASGQFASLLVGLTSSQERIGAIRMDAEMAGRR